MDKSKLTRINLNLPTDLVAKIDDFGDSMNINRTSAICVLVNQALEQKAMVNQLGVFSSILQEQQKKEKE